jgi:hypothetical protein
MTLYVCIRYHWRSKFVVRDLEVVGAWPRRRAPNCKTTILSVVGIDIGKNSSLSSLARSTPGPSHCEPTSKSIAAIARASQFRTAPFCPDPISENDFVHAGSPAYGNVVSNNRVPLWPKKRRNLGWQIESGLPQSPDPFWACARSSQTSELQAHEPQQISSLFGQTFIR